MEKKLLYQMNYAKPTYPNKWKNLNVIGLASNSIEQATIHKT